MPRQRIGDRESFYRSILLDREKNSTVPLQLFCKQHRISAWTFYHWRKRLRKTALVPAIRLPAPPPPFVPVGVNQPFPINRVEAVMPNGVMIRFIDGAGEKTMRVLAGLKWE